MRLLGLRPTTWVVAVCIVLLTGGSAWLGWVLGGLR